MITKLLTEHHLEFLSLKGGCRGSSESTHFKMPHCWKSYALAHFHLQIVKGAGHHVYADRAGLFNALMVQHLEDIDNKADNDLTTTDIDEAAPARTETEVEQVPITQL